MTQNFFQRGAMWLKESLHALRLQPVSLTGIAIFSLMLSGILSSLPLVGSMLAGLWMPFGTVLTAEAARDTLEGRSPSYRSLAAAWSDPAARSGLIGIGVFSSRTIVFATGTFGVRVRNCPERVFFPSRSRYSS